MPSISSFSGVGGDSFRLSGGARQFGSPPTYTFPFSCLTGSGGDSDAVLGGGEFEFFSAAVGQSSSELCVDLESVITPR